MKLHVLPFALTAGILCALYALGLYFYPMVTSAMFSGNMYGGSARFVMEDMYPYYRMMGSVGRPLLLIVFGFVDGFIAGGIFAALYNALSGKLKK